MFYICIIAACFFESLLIPILFFISFISRYHQKSIDVGIGPEPLINNIYHKKALNKFGYSAITFANRVYHITDAFDIRGDELFGFLKNPHYRLLGFVNKYLVFLYLFFYCCWHFKCMYIYYKGGPIGVETGFLWRLEPIFYKIAGVKILVMPYGADIQVMSRCRNLLYKHAMTLDYPNHKNRKKIIENKIDLWTKYSDHIICGCDWVDYVYHWDTLMISHFSIDTEHWKPPGKYKKNNNDLLKVLHAPNHRAIKGTQVLINTINNLKKEGYNYELILIEKLPNDEIRKAIIEADIIADQLIIGWYAMFAIEGMAMEKPVLCYIRPDLENLYIQSGLLKEKELPIINTSTKNVRHQLVNIYNNRAMLKELGLRSRKYVIKHHSLNAVGKKFDIINKSMLLH